MKKRYSVAHELEDSTLSRGQYMIYRFNAIPVKISMICWNRKDILKLIQALTGYQITKTMLKLNKFRDFSHLLILELTTKLQSLKRYGTSIKT
jgi:hypothetical protein